MGISERYLVADGPYGGTGGDFFTEIETYTNGSINQIRVAHTPGYFKSGPDVLGALQFRYGDLLGQFYGTETYPGPQTITFLEDEKIIGIEGMCVQAQEWKNRPVSNILLAVH